MGSGTPILARINGWCALLCLAFLIMLFWLARRAWLRRERVRLHPRYVFDDYGRLIGSEAPNSEARTCRHCGRPIAPVIGDLWCDERGPGSVHCSRRIGRPIMRHEP